MNLLKLNDDQTEFILSGTHQQLDTVSDPKIHIASDTVYPVKAVQNLGIHQDSELKNTTHINKLCSTLAPICKFRKLLTKEAVWVIIQSLVLC